MNEREQKIISAVDSLADDIIDFASRLVAEPSVLGREASAVRVMEDELIRLGLRPRRIPMVPADLAHCPGYAPTPWSHEGRENLAAVRPADGEGGRSALFNGHLDVVSPEPLGFWERDPFEPFIKDGWLHGRGSGDMKSGVAAMTQAVRAVDQAGFGLRAPVTISAVIEEECSGNGALASVLAGYDAEAVLIPEPFGPVIYAAQVGVLWFKVKVKGVPVHVQAAPAGTNAIEKSFPLIAALRGLEEELNRGDRPEAYLALEHPLNLNIGVFNGGDWPSTVPAEAEFHGRLSFFPGMEYAVVRRRVEDVVADAARRDPWLAENPPQVEFYGFRSEGHVVDPELPVFRELSGCHEALAGKRAAPYVSTCTTDLRAFHFFGRGKGTCFGPVAENIHGANERVNIAGVLHTARVYALFLARWCGLVD
ncbi:MAG: ArgE/DapE family deacylase [Pseudomonadota bacterium]